MDLVRMHERFLAEMRDAAASHQRPDLQAVWRHFVNFARTAVELDDAATDYTEDFLLFETYPDEGGGLELRLCRTVGLADDAGDYAASRNFQCFLSYPSNPPDSSEETIWETSTPEEPSAVETFVERVQASSTFDALIRHGRPRKLIIGDR